MKSKKLHILVLCGGRSSEYEVSLKSAEKVLENLDAKKYDSSLAIIEKNGSWRFGSEKKLLNIGEAIIKIETGGFDFVFIAMHGAYGEDGRIQALLELIGLPYAGSGVLSSAMAMNKQVTNILYATNGFLVAHYAVFDRNSKNRFSKSDLPAVIKPVSGGSSVGVSIVKTIGELKKAVDLAFQEDEKVMIQEYLKGREFTCGIVEKNGKAMALSPTEIIPKSSTFFDYEAKYKKGGSLEITPPKLPKREIKKLQELALKAHQVLGCSGMSRSDFILRGKKFYILETNTIPGMTETSLLPQGAKVLGIEFSKLLDLVVGAGLMKRG